MSVSPFHIKGMSLRTSFILSNYLLAGLGIFCPVLSEITAPAFGSLLFAGLAYCFCIEKIQAGNPLFLKRPDIAQ